MITSVILWFRRDLRRAGQVALTAAVESGAGVTPVYALDGKRAIGRRAHMMG